MEYWTLLLQLTPILVIIYFYVRNKQSYWSKRGIDGPRPAFLVGNVLTPTRKGIPETELEWVRKYGKVYGNYYGLTPCLTIADPELIKQVLVKDFHLFMNRRPVKFEHEIWSKNLFLSENEDWKKIRSITSPTFSSGKLKSMNSLMNVCVDKLVAYLDSQSRKASPEIDVKEVIAGFTIDVIASTSFATDTHTNDDRAKQSPFVYHGFRLFRPNPIKFLSLLTMPKKLNTFLNWRYAFPTESFEFFRNLTQTVVNQRKAESQTRKRHDLVQLLIDSYVMEKDLANDGNNYEKLAASMDEQHEQQSEQTKSLTQGAKKTLTNNEIIAQCIIFFVAGFETTASTITHCIFELAQNPALQERLKEELELNLAGLESHSEAYYEKVNAHIPYLDAVIKETLRKHPPVPRLDRRVNVDGYKLAGITLEKEQHIQVAVYAVHHNAEFYPEPERFNPDRFMPENKDQLVPYTYLPFGAGPRNCVGMRFAYQEIKQCLAKIIPLFRFEPNEKTPGQMQFPHTTSILSVRSLPINVRRRIRL